MMYAKWLQLSGELGHAMDAVKWGTDYLIKAHHQPHVSYGEVGDGNTYHYCWQMPEDMTTSRNAYRIDQNNSGSDLAGEAVVAMAAASIVFRHYNLAYSESSLRLPVPSGRRVNGVVSFSKANTFHHKYNSEACTIEMVNNVDKVIEHIHSYGSAHTECIVTDNNNVAEHFLSRVDKYINGVPRFF